MIKPSKKWLALTASMGILAWAGSSYEPNASDIIYNDSNVSITSAVDRCIAEGTDDFIVESPVFVGNAALPAEKNIPVTATDTDAALAAYPEFENKALVAIRDYVNIRAEGNVDAERVGSIGPAGIMTVEEKGEEWSLISSGNCRGYIKNEYILFGDEAGAFAEANLDKVAVVNASALRVRAGESEDSDCLTMIPNGEKYGIVSQGEEWTCIEIDNTLTGYVKNEFIDISYNTVTAKTVEEEAAAAAAQSNEESEEENDTSQSSETQDNGTQSGNPQSGNSQPEQSQSTAAEAPAAEAPADVPYSSVGADVANYALQFVGNPYVYGGTSLTEGADCSGFTMSVYAHFGYSIPRTADVQATVGQEVSLSALQPGDLIFYDHGTGSIGHVAIYIGNGQIVHASTSRTGIIVASYNYSTPCKAVRIIY